jgi:hypothetical protein
MKMLLLLVFILILPFNSAVKLEDQLIHRLDVTYILRSDGSVTKNLEFTFSRAINESMSLTTRGNISQVRISDGQNSLENMLSDDGRVLLISNNGSMLRLNISYITGDRMFQKDQVHFFFQ